MGGSGCTVVLEIGSAFSILFEWPLKKEVELRKLYPAMQLCCISSLHGKCSYKWVDRNSEATFAETPVLYVNKPGLYQCRVTRNSNQNDVRFSSIFKIEATSGTNNYYVFLEAVWY